MTTQPSVYVGTYAKYNGGSIAGEWLNLNDYDDQDEFIQACRELHSDEPDAELMFQDYEGFPAFFYSESGIDPRVWEWLGLDDDQQEILEAFEIAYGGMPDDLDKVWDAHHGHYESQREYAEELIETCYTLEGPLARYFDYDAFTQDLFISDYTFVRGHVFSDNW